MTFPLTLLFMLLVFWRPQDWLFPWLYGWPLLDVVTYGALVGLLMETGQKTVQIPRTPAVMLAVGLWFASVMSHIAHAYFQGVINTIPETFKLCFFLLLLLMVINSVHRLRMVILVLLLGAVVMAIHAVMQERTGVGFAGSRPLLVYSELKDRWVQQSLFFGIFEDPNDTGQFLATCIPLAFAGAKRPGILAFSLTALVVWLLAEAISATHSRGALIGVAAMAGCMFFMLLPSRWMPYAGGLMLAGGLVACALWGGVLLDESAHDRVVFWGAANHYFKGNFMFGGGYGMFGEITGTDRAAHNAFVLCYTELGLFGYWFWFNMLTLGIMGCWRTRVAFRRPKTSEQVYLKRVAGMSIAAMVGFATSAYFLSRAYVFPLFFLFAVLASIPVIAQRHLPAGHPPLINFQKDVLVIGTVASLFSVVYIYITILLLNRIWGG